jgi:glycerol uptake facilitator protein
MNPFVAELIGTMLLILLGNGVVAGVLLKNSKSEGAGWLVICLGWAFGVVFAIYLVGAISGAHLNPAVTISLAVIGKFPWENVLPYVAAQFVGAFLGSGLVFLHYYPHWEKTEDQDLKLAVFCTGPAEKHSFWNFFSEFLGTFVLMLGLCAIGANKFAEGLNPLVIGALIVSIGCSLGGTTGWAINPARDLAPRLAHALLPVPNKGTSNWRYAWIPVLGPIVGGSAGALCYQYLLG